MLSQKNALMLISYLFVDIWAKAAEEELEKAEQERREQLLR